MSVLRFLLFPFSMVYGLIVRIRNYLYDTGQKPSVRFEVPVICVGNLVAGGTGKTPMIEHLVRLLSDQKKVVTLSRGYGRKTKGFRLAGEEDNATTLGDEPFQFYKKFKERIHVAVGEERALAIPLIMNTHEDTEVVLLDDGYQHRQVRPSFSILLTDYSRLFFNDYLLPVGLLREPKDGAQRASAVVVTKCPTHVEEEHMMAIEDEIRKYTPAPVFFSTIHYGEEIRLFGQDAELNRDIVLFTGIANASPLEEYLRSNYHIIDRFNFGDHHTYSASELLVIRNSAEAAGKPVSIVTTEKDAARLSKDLLKVFVGFSVFYLPIEIQFLKNGEDFDNMILHAVNH